MANRRAFKSDTSFLEKISMGATGAIAVREDLERQGHRPIELERGSMSFKIWKTIKIKRIRVPDIFCVDCGKSVESRAKTNLELSMSHSQADPERGWDHGLDNEDAVAFVVCEKVSEVPVDWKATTPIQYLKVGDLRSTHQKGSAVLTTPKGAEEGYEIRIVWPAAIANYPGKVTAINQGRIKFQRQQDNRVISMALTKQGQVLTPLVGVGDRIVPNQVLASVVPVNQEFKCLKSSSESDYVQLLSSKSLSKRYTAAKALAHFPSAQTVVALRDRRTDSGEHIYVRLEAAASLARLNEAEGFVFIESCLKDQYLQNRLEAVILLGEIKNDNSCKILISTLGDVKQDAEIRAGAAWALGELQNKLALRALVDSFSTIEAPVRIEAARALGRLARKYTHEILAEFPKADAVKRSGISWALSKAGSFSISDILGLLQDQDTREWIAYVVGTQDPKRLLGEIERLKEKDSEVYFAVTVLWKIMNSWIWGLEEY